MVQLTSEVAEKETHEATADFGSTIRVALAYADKGMWDFKITLPNGRKLSVERFVSRFNLHRLVNYRPEVIA